MKILITGIAGLIGSNLAKWLLANTDHQVFGIDDLSCGDWQNVPQVPWSMVRLGVEHETTARVFCNWQPDLVYHCAAYAAECLSPFVRRYNYISNLLATADVVNNCVNHRVGRLVYFSSMAVYGQGKAPFDETDTVRPIDPYGIAKAACEADICVAGQQHGLQWTIIRPHNVFGEGQVCSQVYRNVFGIWMNRHLAGLPLRIYGDGKQRRAFSYIGDCLRPLYLAGTAEMAVGKIINLGGSRDESILRAAQTLCGVMGGGRLEFHPPRREVRQAWCTTARSEGLLGYRDQTSLEDGLRAMWRWAKGHEHPAHYPVPLEIREGLYPYWEQDRGLVSIGSPRLECQPETPAP